MVLLSILMLIGATLDFMFGVLILFLSSIEFAPLNIIFVLQIGGIPTLLMSVGLFVSAIFLVILACGVWRGLRWAWRWTLISAIISLIAAIVGMITEIGFGLGIVIFPIVILYLTRPRVRAYFGR